MNKETSRVEVNFNVPGEEAQARQVHLLVIRLSAMGDVAMLVPVLRTLVSTYKEIEVTVLTRGFFAPLFKDIPNVSVYDAKVNDTHRGIFGLIKLAKELRNIGIDAVADLHDVLRSNILKSVFYLFGIPVKQIDKGRKEKKALTKAKYKNFKQLKSTHQRYADVFEDLGFPIEFKNHQFPLKHNLASNIRTFVKRNDKKLLGIAPFAQYQAKTYPMDLLEKVLSRLQKNPDIKILLFGGGAAEEEKMTALEAKFNNITTVAGKLSFQEELALISNLDGMLSMDSGNAHLAANFGIPVVTLWGVTHPFAGFRAFGQPFENCLLPNLQQFPAIPTSIYGNKAPEDYQDVMRTISPETVVEKLKEILKI